MSYGILEGTLAYTCEECGVTITVTRPPGSITSTTKPAARRNFTSVIRAQILWEGTCRKCRDWWNDFLHTCEDGLPPKGE